MTVELTDAVLDRIDVYLGKGRCSPEQGAEMVLIGDLTAEIRRLRGERVPEAEATSVERPGIYNPRYGLWENGGPWRWADPVHAIISDSYKWRNWPADDPELGPFEFRVAQSAIENLYRCGYVLMKAPTDA